MYLDVVGRISKEPKLDRASTGATVVNLDVAVPHYNRRKEGQPTPPTSYVTLVFWGKSAERVVAECRKGQSIHARGSMECVPYTGKGGQMCRNNPVIKVDAFWPMEWSEERP